MNKQEIKSLLQQAVDAVSMAKSLEEDLMCKAQTLGLQGEKRRQRYESAKSYNFIKFLKCDAFDAYGIELELKHVAAPSQQVSGIKGYFDVFLSKQEQLYDMLHTIANKLVVNNCQYYAKFLYGKCACIVEDTKYTRRTILEGNLVNWSPEFILLHQTTMENVHDRYEEKEKEVGYDY